MSYGTIGLNVDQFLIKKIAKIFDYKNHFLLCQPNLVIDPRVLMGKTNTQVTAKHY